MNKILVAVCWLRSRNFSVLWYWKHVSDWRGILRTEDIKLRAFAIWYCQPHPPVSSMAAPVYGLERRVVEVEAACKCRKYCDLWFTNTSFYLFVISSYQKSFGINHGDSVLCIWVHKHRRSCLPQGRKAQEGLDRKNCQEKFQAISSRSRVPWTLCWRGLPLNQCICWVQFGSTYQGVLPIHWQWSGNVWKVEGAYHNRERSCTCLRGQKLFSALFFPGNTIGQMLNFPRAGGQKLEG